MSAEAEARRWVSECRRLGTPAGVAPAALLDDGQAVDDPDSPALVVFAAAQTVVRMLWEEEGGSADRVAALARTTELGAAEKVLLIRACAGDAEALRAARGARGVLTPRSLLVLLCSLLDGKGLTESAVSDLLDIAAGFQRDALRALDSGLPGGPRDVLDVPPADLPGLDLGGIRIPGGRDLELHPMSSDGRVCAVTVVRGRTALQLQAFHAVPGRNWDTVRSELADGVRRRGGTAVEWVGAAGLEVRAQLPGGRPGGAPTVKPVRFLGHDGPGWLLRGVVSGAGAARTSTDDWAYRLFAATVVVPSHSSPEDGPALGLTLPA